MLNFLKHKKKPDTVDLIRETYDNAFTQGFELGRKYERSKQGDTGVILSVRVQQVIEEILKKGGSR